MNKTGKIVTTVVVAAAVAGGAYYLIGPSGLIGPGGETDQAIVQKADSLNKALTLQLVDLETEAKDPEINTKTLDSLTACLTEVKWQPIANGGDYEAKAKEAFLTKKREVAKVLADSYERNRITITNDILKDVSKITE
jgi:hypothetical protein